MRHVQIRLEDDEYENLKAKQRAAKLDSLQETARRAVLAWPGISTESGTNRPKSGTATTNLQIKSPTSIVISDTFTPLKTTKAMRDEMHGQLDWVIDSEHPVYNRAIRTNLVAFKLATGGDVGDIGGNTGDDKPGGDAGPKSPVSPGDPGPEEEAEEIIRTGGATLRVADEDLAEPVPDKGKKKGGKRKAG